MVVLINRINIFIVTRRKKKQLRELTRQNLFFFLCGSSLIAGQETAPSVWLSLNPGLFALHLSGNIKFFTRHGTREQPSPSRSFFITLTLSIDFVSSVLDFAFSFHNSKLHSFPMIRKRAGGAHRTIDWLICIFFFWIY